MNFFRKLTQPPYPDAAIGLAQEGACAVRVERRGGAFQLRQGGWVALPDELVRPAFDEPNLNNPEELAATLIELTNSIGLAEQKRWSATLPEGATRSTIITVEGASAGGKEFEEMFGWKIERAFHHPLAELRVSRRLLAPDASGRARYLVAGTRRLVLEEYEAVFRGLGWHVGLILPRHLGEAAWLMQNKMMPTARIAGDALLVSSHAEGFTAVVLRAGDPVLVRAVACEAEDAADELYRLLLFYRDRLSGATPAPHDADETHTDTADAAQDNAMSSESHAANYTAATHLLDCVLVVGEGLSEDESSRVIRETLEYAPRFLRPEDFPLALPNADLPFARIAAPAGLAAFAI